MLVCLPVCFSSSIFTSSPWPSSPNLLMLQPPPGDLKPDSRPSSQPMPPGTSDPFSLLCTKPLFFRALLVLHCPLSPSQCCTSFSFHLKLVILSPGDEASHGLQVTAHFRACAAESLALQGSEIRGDGSAYSPHGQGSPIAIVGPSAAALFPAPRWWNLPDTGLKAHMHILFHFFTILCGWITSSPSLDTKNQGYQ